MVSYKHVGTTNRHVYLQSEETEEDDFPALEETEEMTHPALETSLGIEIRLELKYWQQEHKKVSKIRSYTTRFILYTQD